MTGPRDLTRWNRAGLSRFSYTEGNAALHLERLRAKMVATFLRGLPQDHPLRQADYWFHLHSAPDRPAPSGPLAGQPRAGLTWKALADGLPGRYETASERNARLVANYLSPPSEPGFEIMRAFARAMHVMTGYLDAYANEGYIGTATQWPSLRGLAEMVNYAARPAASAETAVALILAPEAGTQRIARGLAMQSQPPDAAPLIFETLEEITAHPGLNALRLDGFTANDRVFDPREAAPWQHDRSRAPVIGDIAVLARNGTGVAVTVAAATPEAGLSDRVRLSLEGDGVTATLRPDEAVLHYAPALTLLPEAVSGSSRIAVSAEGAAGIATLGMVEVQLAGGAVQVVRAEAGPGGTLMLETSPDVTGIRPLIPLAAGSQGWVETAQDRPGLFLTTSGIREIAAPENEIAANTTVATTGIRKADGKTIAWRYELPQGTRQAAIRASGSFQAVRVHKRSRSVTTRINAPAQILSFAGKPPAGLAAGDWFVEVDGKGHLTPLMVEGVQIGAGRYSIGFDRAVNGQDPDVVYLGPMMLSARPAGHDANPGPVPATGALSLSAIPAEAAELLRPGRALIIEDEAEAGRTAAPPQLTTILEILPGPPLTLRLGVPVSLAGFTIGRTVLRLNVVRAGHGETKPGPVLGSGRGDLARQSFALPQRNISHVADARRGSGVRADIEVRVDDQLWEEADLTDPLAEDQPCWSARVEEDDTLQIVFRRRLPSGVNNIRLAWHRVGSGAAGNALPAGSITRPRSRHRFVSEIRQPFAGSGGADREPVAAIRENAGAGLQALDRAVSVEDFARLARRHVAIRAARARLLPAPGRGQKVELVLVPGDGGVISAGLRQTLLAWLYARALPGVTLQLVDFGRLPFTARITLRIDRAGFVDEDVTRAARAALMAAYGVGARALGDPVYATGLTGVLEQVPGVVTSWTTLAAPATARPDQILVAAGGTGAIRAIRPEPDQLAFLESPAALIITTEAAP